MVDAGSDAPRPTGEPPHQLPRRRSRMRATLPWLLATAVVLVLAVAGGLLTAYFVADLRAVPPPAALLTPAPTPTATPTTEPSETAAATEPTPQPRYTPTPAPTPTVEATPLVHIVQRRETLSYIAALYGVSVNDILQLNDISNPNNIHPGDVLLIPAWAPNRP